MISKRPIKEEMLIRLYRLFFEIITKADSKADFLLLMNEILSPTEKIMIAKRIGIVYLLIKKVDHRTIRDVLKVSTATTEKYALYFHNKNSYLVNIIRGMLIKEKTMGFLEDFLAGLMIQPGIKIGHHKLAWEHKKRQEERKTLP